MSKQSELSDVMNDGRSLVYGAFMGMSRPPLTHDEERFRNEIRVEVADRGTGIVTSDFAGPYRFIAPPPPSAELGQHGNGRRGWPAATPVYHFFRKKFF
mgnify:FL=1